MLSKLRSYRPSHAVVVAYLALFVALGGSSYAAITVTGKNVKNSSLTGKDVKNNSLTGSDVKGIKSGDVKDRSLLAKDFKAGQLPRGPKGDPGPSTGTAGGDLRGNYPNPQLGTLPGARVRRGTNQTIPENAEETFLTWDTEVFDNGNVHSTSTNSERMTAPAAGTYLASVAVRWDPGSDRRYLGITDSSDTRLASVADFQSVGTGSSFDQSVTTVVRLAAGDYVRAVVYNYDTSPRDITNQEELSSFSLQLMSR